jgi:hypothetical protein
MGREICFCGREGAIEDREPVYLGDGDWGLACPECGHLDRLHGWPEAARQWTLAEAMRRRAGEDRAPAFARPGLAA